MFFAYEWYKILSKKLSYCSQVKFILPNAKSTQEGISEKVMRSS